MYGSGHARVDRRGGTAAAPATGDERHRRGALVGPGGDCAQRRPARLAAGTPPSTGSATPAAADRRRLAVRFEGTAAGVAAQTAALRERLDGATPEALANTDEAALWRSTRPPAEPGQSTAFAGTLPSRLTAVATRRRRADAAGVRLAGLPQRTRAAHRSVFRTAGATGGGVRPVAPRGVGSSAAPCCCGSAPPRSTPPSTRSVPHPRPSVSRVPSRPGWIPTAAAPRRLAPWL